MGQTRVVHVVYKEGPEWTIPVEGWFDHKSAKRRVDELDDSRRQRLAERDRLRTRNPDLRYSNEELEDRLSGYKTQPLTIRDAP